jgi:hypothetical protein
MFVHNHLKQHQVAYHGVNTANPFELSIFGASAGRPHDNKGKV